MSNSTMEMRAWQFQDSDWGYLQTAIPLAAQSGMNRIQLSHGIIMRADELLDEPGAEAKRQLVSDCIALAHQHGLKVDIWTHELCRVPEQFTVGGKVKFVPELQRYIERKYDRLFGVLPELDGIVLTFAESEVSLYQDEGVISELPPVERVARITEAISNVCERKRRPLFLRPFVWGPDELRMMERALAIIAKRLGNRQNLFVMEKYVPYDWHPYFPFHPFIGNCNGMKMVVEMDLGNEFTGRSTMPYMMHHTIGNTLEYCEQQAVIGMVARVERYSSHAFGTLNEANISVYNQMVQGTDSTAEQLYQNWCIERFGTEAGAEVARILARSFDIVNRIMFPLNHWLTEHSQLSSLAHGTAHISDISFAMAGWVSSPHLIYQYQRLQNPNDDIILELHSEKELARELCRRSVDELTALGPCLSAENAALLKQQFELMKTSADVAELQQIALLRIVQLRNMLANGSSVEERTVIGLKAHKSLQLLLRMAPDVERQYGNNRMPANPQRIELIVREYTAELQRLLGE